MKNLLSNFVKPPTFANYDVQKSFLVARKDIALSKIADGNEKLVHHLVQRFILISKL